ncbi:11932_t:CDS:2 [Ambispora gerdemannii]|uniref:11932_t:CDS:1 n=1 Tax=Ambispora gerdemannii TaxID=144530 RepID=A0A9N9CMZ4_9GLOM|nr:11932_t:CDS:2 [Ambispora gerdemannii]
MAATLAIVSITESVLGEILKGLGSVNRKTAITIKNYSAQILDQHNVYFDSGTSDLGLPGPVLKDEGLVWGARKTAGPVATGTVGVFVYHIRNQKQSLAFMWSVPFDYNIYDNLWKIQVYDDLYKKMLDGSPNKGDSKTYKKDLDFGWRYEGSMGSSGTPFIDVKIYKN